MLTIILVSIGFALFLVCPRMAAMMHIITTNTQTNIVYISVIGTIIALPLAIAMAFIFKKYGLIGALAFGIVTDIAAALLFGKTISLKTGIETFIISIFVVTGARVAAMISNYLIR